VAGIEALAITPTFPTFGCSSFASYACCTVPFDWSALFNFPKQFSAAIKSPKTGFTLIVVSGGLLAVARWLPATDSTVLQKYHLWFIVGFLLGVAILLIAAIELVSQSVSKRLAFRKAVRELTPDEKHTAAETPGIRLYFALRK
jgi:hypothetical protein